MLPSRLQNKLLKLLIFDDKLGKLIQQSLPVEVWSNDPPLFALISRIYEHWNTYKKAPDDDIAIILEGLNVNKDGRKKLEGKLNNIMDENVENNIQYVMDMLNRFHRRYHLKRDIKEAAQLIEIDNLDEAERVMMAAARRKVEVFDSYLGLHDHEKVMGMKKTQDTKSEKIKWGIPALDDLGIGPGKKELLVYVAGFGTGKSWSLVNFGAKGIENGKSGIHFTLENSKEITLLRYYQALFGMSAEPMDGPGKSRFNIDFSESEAGLDLQLTRALESGSKNFIDDYEYLKRKLDMRFPDARLIIEEHPAGSMTVDRMNARLDAREMQDGLIFDQGLVDYADLFKIRKIENKTDELEQIYVGIRATATERNMAFSTASQVNRDGLRSANVRADQLAGAVAKSNVADIMISYSQTEDEKELGLARLYVIKSRNTRGGQEILIAQDYQHGQFVVNSIELTKLKKRLANRAIENTLTGLEERE